MFVEKSLFLNCLHRLFGVEDGKRVLQLLLVKKLNRLTATSPDLDPQQKI